MNKVRFAGAMFLAMSVAAFAQQPPPPNQTPPQAAQPGQPPAQATPLTPDQLDNLVAPIALYPDPLLGQILAASTYPLEIVEANQWLQQNRNLSGQQLLDAAQTQNWDPSVQALVAFPDVMTRLTQDIRWTTDLGNAFLAQQADVMNAVQRMRARAQADGKLQSNSQETVTTQQQGDQSAIDVEPANPQIVYVPEYNPAYVWGAPVVGYYPPLFYPGIDVGFGFGAGIYIGGFFGGCCGWGNFGWGWGPNWFGHGLYVNNYFLHRYGFHDFHGGEFHGTEAWAHNPDHRMGVPYPNRDLANHFGPAARAGGAGFNRGFEGGSRNGFSGGARNAPAMRPSAPSEQHFGSPGFERQNPGGNHSAFGGIQNGGQTRIQSDHGFSSMGHMGGGGGFHGGGRGH